MAQDWTSAPASQAVKALKDDPRPAWLWSPTGSELVWANAAAGLFGARLVAGELRRASDPHPIKGQINRILRLGLLGQPMMSRLQFIAGRKPLSASCLCTPVGLGESGVHLLVVAVEPIAETVREAAGIGARQEPQPPTPMEGLAPDAQDQSPPDADDGSGPIVEALDAPEADQDDHENAPAAGDEPDEQDAPAPTPPQTSRSGLGALVDKLARETRLYEPLDSSDDAPLPPAVDTTEGAEEPAPADPAPSDEAGSDAPLALAGSDEGYVEPPDAEHDREPDTAGDGATERAPGGENIPGPDPEDDEAAFIRDDLEEAPASRHRLWRITGRGLFGTPGPEPEAQDIGTPEAPDVEEAPETPDSGATETGVERVDPEPSAGTTADEPARLDPAARYNFEELSRILGERVGRDSEKAFAAPNADAPAAGEAPLEASPQAGGELVTLSDAALVLNRVPMGIMIFRDQDTVFVNRAMLDMTGYENASLLRSKGPGVIFPNADERETAGPMTHILRRDGQRLAVSARLQTVTWQGRQAFMLSARQADPVSYRETEIRTFAALQARLLGGTFFQTDRTGRITTVVESGKESPPDLVVGRPLTEAVNPSDAGALMRFLALPARYADTERPGTRLSGRRRGDVVTVFAEGRAGVVAGYFGSIMPAGLDEERDGGLSHGAISRIGRELRRPLNTISGFSELLVEQTYGPLHPRYLDYARDIVSAGQAVSDLADELDEFLRVSDRRTRLPVGELDLSELLEECVMRIRAQAGSARVLLRSAISERLPVVRADRATLRQAVLNMLASAIAESPAGGKVVLSAQAEDDGSVSVHVRDTQKAPNALLEQFVVFRDGENADGTQRQPMRSSIGLTLTRSLVAANACTFTISPASDSGALMTLTIPAVLVAATGT
ncbi:ATP-binding protein [Pelagibacterium montanilacus]|uniref:ATP-binding protein n=1 Tax=Pelagibacterium montanilacus TaxID=2185280 RepID=UPI000F8F2469|nr:ATP-binding protein [Pelagibacterium montanilacus]